VSCTLVFDNCGILVVLSVLLALPPLRYSWLHSISVRFTLCSQLGACANAAVAQHHEINIRRGLAGETQRRATMQNPAFGPCGARPCYYPTVRTVPGLSLHHCGAVPSWPNTHGGRFRATFRVAPRRGVNGHHTLDCELSRWLREGFWWEGFWWGRRPPSADRPTPAGQTLRTAIVGLGQPQLRPDSLVPTGRAENACAWQVPAQSGWPTIARTP